MLLVVSNASLKGKYESLNEFLGKTVSTTIEPETVEYKVPVNKQTNKPNVEYIVNNDGTVEVLKEEQTSLEMGDDVQEVEEVAVQVSKETIDEFIKKATTIEWPESVTINVRGVLHRIDEGEALEEIAADHDVSVDNLINQVEIARQHFAPFADSWSKNKENIIFPEKTVEDDEEEIEE
ncbi:hypothetical protein UO3_02382 [Enterococcus faecalis EnGen0286]|nr:hypothetical protein UO3_02382 [Enterococcus faecalis EnGen0286]